ncbi:MAG TPA: chorismate mutase [Acidothermaceae bacterium]|jgi:chorismate mutase|nr:chorismate mutase [Acidothermaceae bacterium]
MNQSLTETTSEAAPEEADEAAALISQLREQIDEVDAELISIVQRRIALSKQIQGVRMSHGGPRRQHSRELKIVNTYVEGLGRGGSQLALTVLELSRGRA